MNKIKINTEFIKLDQFLKWIGIAENGVMAKEIILSGEVKVNEEEERRRGKKLYPGDVIFVFGKEYTVE
ncbi:MAG: S4 domain-containing protein YaaA [Fusobacterium sp. JB021]|nr:S4 domain-containing protein YaaA [Fusobacterium sp. JB020]MDP0494552.1 S4 domain-containing protein YaaA [Fusobacterium sp. JB021]MDP0507577.1 S4 domain-containing protein YaaA [Fusobacterium sp. JB019]